MLEKQHAIAQRTQHWIDALFGARHRGDQRIARRRVSFSSR